MSQATSFRYDAHVPNGDALVIFAVLISGFAAAATAEPRLWIATPVFAIALLASSRAGMQRTSTMPEELKRTLDDTLAALPSGDAKKLFERAIASAVPVVAARVTARDHSYDHNMQESVCDLMQFASQVALDLSRLDTALASGALEQRKDSVRASAERARNQYAKQLNDVASAITAVFATGLAYGTPESERVAELVTEMRDETGAMSEALREVDEILGIGG